ncbi:tRNA (guanine(26)-N(2))-dimethyltransferase, partial [Dissostichus eleginoides]
MYFPTPGFIAPLLREWEPRRLFNIISSSQYIIPQQILVYLQTRLRYIERDEERAQGVCWRADEEGGSVAVASLSEFKSLTQKDRKGGRHPFEKPPSFSMVSSYFNNRHQMVACLQRSHVSHSVMRPDTEPVPSSAIPLEGDEAPSFGLPHASAWFDSSCCRTLSSSSRVLLDMEAKRGSRDLLWTRGLEHTLCVTPHPQTFSRDGAERGGGRGIRGPNHSRRSSRLLGGTKRRSWLKPVPP